MMGTVMVLVLVVEMFAGTRGMGTMVPFVSVQNILVPALRPILVAAALSLGLGTLAIALGWAAPLGIAFALGIVLLWVLIRRARDKEPSSRRTADQRGISSEFWRFAGMNPVGVSRLTVKAPASKPFNFKCYNAGAFKPTSKFGW